MEQLNIKSPSSLVIHIPTVLNAMLQLWWLAMLFLVTGGSLGVLMSMSIGKSTYRCQTLFLYAPKRVESVASFPVLSLETNVNLIKIPGNLQKMSEKTGIPARQIANVFKVVMAKKEGMLTLTVESDNPKNAYRYIKSIAEVFLEAQVEKRKELAMEYIRAFKGQYEKSLANLKKAEESMQEFTHRNKIVDISKEKQWYIEKSVNLDMELQKAEVERSAVELKLQKLQDIIDKLEKQIQTEKSKKVRTESISNINLRKERLMELVDESKKREELEAELKFKQKELESMIEMQKKNLVAPHQVEIVRQGILVLITKLNDTDQVKKWKDEIKKLDEFLVPDSEKDSPTSIILREIMLQSFTLQLEQSATADKVRRYEEERAKVEKYLRNLGDLQEKYDALTRVIDIELDAVKKHRSLIEGAELVAQLQTPDFLEISPPQMPEKPSKSNRKIIALSITSLFLAIGVGLTLLLSCISLSIRSGGEATARFRKILLGEFPDRSHHRNPGILARIVRRLSKRVAAMNHFQRSTPCTPEDYKEFHKIVVRLIVYLTGKKCLTFLMASCDRDHGSRIVRHLAHGLACFFARMGYPILVVDLTEDDSEFPRKDFASLPPSLWEKILADLRPHCVSGEQEYNVDGVPAYFSCTSSHEKMELLNNKFFQEFIAFAREQYQVILLLSPMTEDEANFRLSCRLSDTCIMAIEAGSTPFWNYYPVFNLMEEENCPVLGTIVTGVRPPFVKNEQIRSKNESV